MAGAVGPLTLESLDARLTTLSDRLESTRTVIQTKLGEVDSKDTEQDDALGEQAGNIDALQTVSKSLAAYLLAS